MKKIQDAGFLASRHTECRFGGILLPDGLLPFWVLKSRFSLPPDLSPLTQRKHMYLAGSALHGIRKNILIGLSQPWGTNSVVDL